MKLINKQRAYEIASQWGSYISSGDPGACFYGFKVADGRPQNQEHRHDCLNYIDNLLNSPERKKPLSNGNIKELKSLERWFLYCPDVNGEFEHK